MYLVYRYYHIEIVNLLTGEVVFQRNSSIDFEDYPGQTLFEFEQLFKSWYPLLNENARIETRMVDIYPEAQRGVIHYV